MVKKHTAGRVLILVPLLTVLFFGAVLCFMFFRAYPLRYPSLVYEYAEKYDLEPEIVCAVINTESHFDENAVSSAGAAGLMQLMKPTADWAAEQIGLEDYSYENINDPKLNIELGCWLLNSLIYKYGDLETALCAYNAGSGNVDRWLDEGTEDGSLTDIPYFETRNYISKVKTHTAAYRFILNIIGGKYEA
ncbi:MAG: lytic transglycosylase domain-containing protein [Clostridiales bacterium]|nr:lytic transglycosylase domain-containing protein [Clostridiales bacterium]